MAVTHGTRVPITRREFYWLQTESDRWIAGGVIDPITRDRIIAHYDTDALQRQGMLAVVLLAVGMCAVGLLLLIGYNWPLIPRGVKIAIVTGAVAAAYAGAAVAYARGRLVAGETLAFGGTLLFANAIVLVAQVLQMSGNFADAVMWFTIGVLATAWLVRSKWAGIEAALALFLWLTAQGSSIAGPQYPFLALWPVAVLVAYSIDSPVMLFLLVLDAGFWPFMSGLDTSHNVAWLGSVALTACALYSVGRWHPRESLKRWAWQGGGLLMLFAVLLPLMASQVQQSLSSAESAPFSTVLALVAGTIAVFHLARHGGSKNTDRALIAASGAVIAWILFVWYGQFGHDATTRTGTVLFSLVTLGIAVSLIRDALESDGTRELALGVLFGAGFLVIRWTSLIENMFWSGLLLVAAGGGLLLVARLWRTRRRGGLDAGRAS